MWYVTNGYAIIPLNAYGSGKDPKAPAIKNWVNAAFTTATEVESWWSKSPTSNIGILCGNLGKGTGVVVIDCDEHPDRDESGLKTLNDYEKDHGELPETLVAITGSGGMHFLYRTDRNIPKSEDKTEDKRVGIDIRADGSYIVASPSVHPNGKAYEWQDWPWDMEPTEADDDVIEFIEYVQRESKAETSRVNDARKDGEVLSLVLPEVTREGSRDDTLFRYASSERARNVPYEAVLAAAHKLNEGFMPPLPDSIVIQKVNSAFKYPAGTEAARAARNLPVYSVASSLNINTSRLVQYFVQEDVTYKTINDRRLSAMFAEIYSDTIAWVPDHGKGGSFAAYDGAKWTFTDGYTIIDGKIKDFIYGLQFYCLGIEDDEDEGSGKSPRQLAKKAAGSYDSYAKRKNLREDLKSEMSIVRHDSDFDKNPHLLCVGNRTIDFTDGTNIVIRDHDPADLITRFTPVMYDRGADCPLFVKTLGEALEGDVDTMRYVQKVFGKTIAGDVSDDRCHAFGDATRSSKGTVTNALYMLLGGKAAGSYAVFLQRESFYATNNEGGDKPRSDLKSMSGRRLILTSEFDKAVRINEQLIKQMTGGDCINARGQYATEGEQFKMQGQLIMLVNAWPIIEDEAIISRGDCFVCVPFMRHLDEDERDKSLRTALESPEELSGLLNWCIEGYRLACTEGYEPSEAVANLTREFSETRDPMLKYIRERLSLDRGRSYGVTQAEVLSDFKDWNANWNNGNASYSRNEFYSSLRQHVHVHPKGITRNGKRTSNVLVGYDFTNADSE